MKISYEKIWKFHFFVVYLYYKRKTKEQNKIIIIILWRTQI